jgi:4-hydroxybenzoate polyprenyltransferase
VASGTTSLSSYRAPNAGDPTTGNGQTSGTRISHGISSALKWLVYSNLYCAIFCVGAMTAAMMVLLRLPVNPVLLLIAFSGSMLIYGMNRRTDWQEDQISLPERTEFSRRYGGYFLAAAIPLFGISLVLATLQSIAALLVVLMPFVIGILYSHFRIKGIFLLKNLAISLGASASLLLVVAVYFPSLSTWLPLFGIIITGVLVNTIVFDIKDIPGDSSAGIRTLPVTLGIRWTQVFCFFLLAIMVLLAIPLIWKDSVFWALVPYILYKGLYIAFLPTGASPWWFYGLVVDGEFVPLLAFSLLLS